MYPIFDPLPAQNTGNLFVKITADELTNTTAKCGVLTLPTFQLYDKRLIYLAPASRARFLRKSVAVAAGPPNRDLIDKTHEPIPKNRDMNYDLRSL